jgi:hypothetical protein
MLRLSVAPVALACWLALTPAVSAAPRVVLIGVDGATWNVIDPLLAEGKLPNLAALMKRGVHADLATVEPVNSPTVWTAMATGQPPDVTGIASFLVDERDIQVPRVFEWLSHQGLRVGMYQYLVTWPPRPLPNGFVIPGWLAGGPETVPADLADSYRYDIEGLRSRQAFWEASFAELKHKPAAFNALVERFDLDAGAVSFYALDNLSHRFWAHSFPETFDAETVAELEPRFAGTLQKAYVDFDTAVGEIAAALPDETAIVVVSDHGFEAHGSPQRRWSFFLEEQLHAAVPPGNDYVLASQFSYNTVRVLKGPFEEREAALARVEAWYESFTTLDGDPLFWAQPVDIAERPEGHGRGFIERMKQSVLRGIGSLFGASLDDDAHGFVIAFPLGGWEDAWPDGKIRIGEEIVATQDIVYGDGFSGNHIPTAVFIAAGPGIRNEHERADLSVLDVAPLYAWLARTKVPEGLAGQLPVSLLDPAVLAERPLETVPADHWPRLPVSESAVDDADLQERLKAMGYAN